MRAVHELDHHSRSFAALHYGTVRTTLLSLLPIALASTGCLGDELDEPSVSETSQAATVSTYVSSGCSTAVVLGLSKQIADEVGCGNPTGLVRFQPSTRLQLTSNAVLPYLAKNAKANLEAVAATRTVQVNSAFRTVAQQYLLYRWYLAGRCGITAAATPGRSNHESGRALDVANYSTLISAMSARGWSHSVPGDPVHFDHFASADIRGQDVTAFQKLWNRNHPTDKIAEDGAYGPQTETRLRQAPATGFALGASCGSTNYVIDVLSVDGPDRVQPLARAHYRVTLQNNGDVEWPGTAVLRVATGGTTQLHDTSWMSTTEIAQLGNGVPAGTMATLDFDVTTPNVTAETPIFEQLTLSDGGTQLGTVNLALTVVPGMAEPTSGEADDIYDQELSGGCSTGKGSTSLIVVGAIFLLRRRRRNYATAA